jgi:hypothetical protein
VQALFYLGETWRLLFVLDKFLQSGHHLPLDGKSFQKPSRCRVG